MSGRWDVVCLCFSDIKKSIDLMAIEGTIISVCLKNIVGSLNCWTVSWTENAMLFYIFKVSRPYYFAVKAECFKNQKHAFMAVVSLSLLSHTSPGTIRWEQSMSMALRHFTSSHKSNNVIYIWIPAGRNQPPNVRKIITKWQTSVWWFSYCGVWCEAAARRVAQRILLLIWPSSGVGNIIILGLGT